MPSRNWFYHTKCYNEWKNNSFGDDQTWHDLIYDFIARDLKVTYDYFLIEAQIKNYLKNHQATMKGIYFALKYYYEVKKNPWNDDKAHGGIGIIPYIYKDSTEYWVAQEQKHQGFIKELEEQLKERAAREVIKIKPKVNQKKKPKFSLEDI